MATNGFFGKMKAFFKGGAKAATSKVSYQQAIGRAKRKPAPTAHDRKTTTGAFGGTGTGRGMRGMPGRKLIKKTVESGWKAYHRIQFGVKRAPSTGGVGGTRMRKRLERIGAIRSWKQENAYRKAQCVMLFGTKHAPKGGLEKNRNNAVTGGAK